MTEINWNPLTSIDQLEEINTLSHTHPVVIFKHSTRCSISAASLSRLERKWDNQKVGELKPYFLDLIAYRELSNQIAERFAVDHQSPQVLIIQNGKSIYDNSHFGISFDEIVENIKPISA